MTALGDEVLRPREECRERIRVDTVCNNSGQERLGAAEE